MPIKKMSLSDFFSYISDIQKPFPPHLRFGQNCFAVLYGMRADIAHEIAGSDVDPFSNDLRIPSFLAKLLGDFVKVDSVD